jgi:hypothetical protein
MFESANKHENIINESRITLIFLYGYANNKLLKIVILVQSLVLLWWHQRIPLHKMTSCTKLNSLLAMVLDNENL